MFVLSISSIYLLNDNTIHSLRLGPHRIALWKSLDVVFGCLMHPSNQTNIKLHTNSCKSALFRFLNEIQWPHLPLHHQLVMWAAFAFHRTKGHQRGKGSRNPEKLVSRNICWRIAWTTDENGNSKQFLPPTLWFLFGLGRVRVRKPWPGSPRMKDSPNQSPKQQQGSSSVDFAPSSPSYQNFPKQVKSPPSARRVPRKKSLKKTKVTTIWILNWPWHSFRA